MNKEEQDNRDYERVLPENALDYNMMMINSEWGKRESINPELVKKLTKINFILDDKGNPVTNEEGDYQITKSDLWATLGFYTKDMRFGNLSQKQYNDCIYWINLASDFLMINMIEPFIVCLNKVASILELSQSLGGFLRNRQNTLTTEQKISNLEPAKRSLLTGKENPQSSGTGARY
jgi:hypothetical protein